MNSKHAFQFEIALKFLEDHPQGAFADELFPGTYATDRMTAFKGFLRKRNFRLFGRSGNDIPYCSKQGKCYSLTQNMGFLPVGEKVKEEHVHHNLVISAQEAKYLTVGELKKQLGKLEIPDDAIIKFPGKEDWQKVQSLSFCYAVKEVSIW